jgi:hypothetical protein
LKAILDTSVPSLIRIRKELVAIFGKCKLVIVRSNFQKVARNYLIAVQLGPRHAATGESGDAEDDPT